jgi:ribonuclease Y
MSSTISLVIGAVGLLAAVFALIVVLRRPPNRDQPAVPASPAPEAASAETASAETASAAAAAQRAIEEASQEADQVRSRAETEAAAIVRDAALAAEKAAERAALASRDADEELRTVRNEARELRADLERREARLAERESRLDAEFGKLEERSAGLDQTRRDLETRRADLDRLDEERRQVLEQAAGLTADQAKSELVSGIQNQAKREAALLVRETENAARRDGEERARRIVTLAIQRVASEQTSESVVSVLHLPGDEMKGRIIGREGRNIRAFESVTGVNLIIDDTPEAVLLSCFDPVRREVGRLTLERLVLDGRIHPQRRNATRALFRDEKQMSKPAISTTPNTIGLMTVSETPPPNLMCLGSGMSRKSAGKIRNI